MEYMKWNFSIYIKSHCSLPDYENECEAPSKIDAAQIFAKLPALREHTWQELMPFIELEKHTTPDDIDPDYEAMRADLIPESPD